LNDRGGKWGMPVFDTAYEWSGYEGELSYPWPQSPSAKQIKDVAHAPEDFRTKRRATVTKHGQPLRELYRTLDLPGNHPLKDLQFELDEAVRNAYGMFSHSNPLDMLLELNVTLAGTELKNSQIVGPSLPKIDGLKTTFVSSDCNATIMDKEGPGYFGLQRFVTTIPRFPAMFSSYYRSRA
jgi:hypothetical protein